MTTAVGKRSGRGAEGLIQWFLKAFKHHAQVIGHFNKDFVHTGKFPADIAGKIKEAQNLREACDYADFYIVSIADTETQLKTAHEIVGLVEQYLQSEQDEK